MTNTKKKWLLLSGEDAFDGRLSIANRFVLILDARTIDFKSLKSKIFFRSLQLCSLCIVCNDTNGTEDDIDEYLVFGSGNEELFFPTMSADDISEVQSVAEVWHDADHVVVCSTSTDFFEKVSTPME